MGLPMLMVHLPVFIIALAPVVLIETWWIARHGRNAFRALLGPVLRANLVSTLVGVPATWFVLVVIQMSAGGGGYLRNPVAEVTLQSPWLIPDRYNMDWKVPAAAAALCPIFYVLSAWSELMVLRPSLKRLEIQHATRAVWMANALTYGLILGFWCWQLARTGGGR